ncbi:MAG: hypothetical protein SNH01_04355 [Rikenellaceae bacterium]
MGTVYKMRCRYCGGQFDHYGDGASDVTAKTQHAASTKVYVETQIPIRCPGCLRRLNNTEDDYRQQVKVVEI